MVGVLPNEDFDIDSLAAYLHLDPGAVAKLADRGKLPGRKVAGKWVFSASEIHRWLEQRIGLSDEVELQQMEQVLRHPPEASRLDEVRIADLLPLEAVAVPLHARTRNSAIQEMVDLAAGTGWLWDAAKMAEAVRQREEMHSTALDVGVALLHPRRPMASILGEAFLALGITSRAIPFGDDRGTLTDIFFLICSVDDRTHLRTLARLSRLISDADLLVGLRAAENPSAARKIIVAREAELLG